MAETEREEKSEMCIIKDRIKELALEYALLYGCNLTLEINVDTKSKSAIFNVKAFNL